MSISELIERFKREHHEIDRALKEAKLLGAATPKGHKRLLEARDLIIQHLKEENDELYPSLAAAGKNNPIISEDLERFKETLEPVTDKAIAFFERYCLFVMCRYLIEYFLRHHRWFQW